jgi:hypothetical protein
MMKLLTEIRVGVVITAAIFIAVFGGPDVCAGENKNVTLELTRSEERRVGKEC